MIEMIKDHNRPSACWAALLERPWMLGPEYERLHPAQQAYVMGLLADKLADQVYLECERAVLQDRVFTACQDDPRTAPAGRITDPEYDYLMSDEDFSAYLDLVARHCAEHYPDFDPDELRGRAARARERLISWGRDVLRRSPSYDPKIEIVFDTAAHNLTVAGDLADKLMRLTA